ncbi:23S rRNA (adenine(2503)-C(2))-methyltransferase RlmN [bacterium]|jgi:23S rRNA (adenine2503-C2)-methyltransferase|nr:23S rRNA (adenine(2503)-C(2))-methyltransferase RlmN [bacterium]MBT4495456.1 23S rRNA (adenine(2503)-C(2))-methyltransferase RlmN [bacterium]MBT4763920.1 23S rRNA (adenine(2503)-C(2))-methyltransferase RlmN [bacterium]MBT5401291.1 23S rRNA (adenine(2503)-C(2))-methyltransferase RlmN [bacterium]MBT5942750.1 23S rRNA (adenine(2503)-C(2))-methyltransferase RlmN [bacterium]
MNILSLKKILSSEPKFRFKQVMQAIYVDFVYDWDEVTTLSKELRSKLNIEAPLVINSGLSESKDKNTNKVLITLEDGLQIETVLMKHINGRRTVCVSSQVGCPLACTFCDTGKMGFKRNLTSYEIIEQVIFWGRILKKNNERVSNVVFMGMGEPFLNYDNVMKAIRVLNDKDGFDIGARKISISTAGLVTEIRKLAKEDIQVNLAISLHAPNDVLRSKLMPVNKQVSLKKLFEAIDYYIDLTNRKVMFEYLMIDKINDSEIDAKQLAELMSRPLYMVNLIPYNPTNKYQPSSQKAIDVFKNILRKRGVNVNQRFGFGQDIKAACGQLAGKKK